MGISLDGRLRAAAALAAALGLAGCANNANRPLYYWGDYQPRVYEHLKGKNDGPQAELAKLTETQEKARSENLALPPGFNAHLGLLYLQAGQGEKARAAFLTEKAQFPESATYMDFLMRPKGTASSIPKATPVVPAPTASPIKPTAPAKPAATAPANTGKPQ